MPIRKDSIAGESMARWVASVLSSAWRSDPEPLSLSPQQLAAVSPLLLGSGAAALAWYRIKNSEFADSEVAYELKQAYRHHTLEAALHERDIKTTAALLRSKGIEALLIKGWSVARLYPEKGLRPYEDIDIVVRKEQYDEAQKLIAGFKSTHFAVDLHEGLSKAARLNEDIVFASSELATLGDVEVRVPRPEDSLRLLCLHLLGHGAFRPLWFCDIGVAVESRPPDFDWDRCLGNDKRVADWVSCTIGLAHQLLGVRVNDTPIIRRAENLPRWLLRSVLAQWEKPFSKFHGVARHRAPMSTYVRTPSGIFGDLRTRWPNAIEATIHVGGPFNSLPRWPFQVGECISRTANFIVRSTAG